MKSPNKKKRIRRKRKKIIIAAACGGLCIAIATGVFVYRRNSGPGRAMAGEMEMPALTATVAKGDLSSTIEGTGTLQNESSYSVKIPSGLEIEEVMVEEGDSVKAGDVLAVVDEISLLVELYTAEETIEDLEEKIDDADSDTAEYYELVKQLNTVEEKYEALTGIADDYTIVAEADGIITTVNISDGTSDDTTDSTLYNNTMADASQNSITQTSASIMTLNTSSDDYEAGNALYEADAEEEETIAAMADTVETISITKIDSWNIAAPVAGESPVTKIQETDGFTGEITWNPSDSVFKGETAYSANVILTAKSGYRFDESISLEIASGSIFDIEVTNESEKNTLTFKVTFAKTEKEETTGSTDNATENNNTQNNTQDNTTQNNTAQNNNIPNDGTQNTQQQGSMSAMQGASDSQQSALAGAVTGSGSASAVSTSTDVQDASASSSASNDNFETAFEMTSGSTMTLQVSVDELDILSVTEGQKAVVVLDAIEDEEFEGQITSIDTNGSSNNGVTKYYIEVTIAKSDSMMSGMNASVSIITEEKSDVIVIPAIAINERGNTSYVYTDRDEESGELTGEVEVETGSSDGANVEIVSGLSEGDTVYYEIADTSSSDSMEMPFGNMEMPSDGFPGGGEMPSGGFPGGGSGGGPGGMGGGM